MREKTRETRHTIAWLGSLSALPIAVIGVIKGASPVQVALWLMLVAVLQLIRLLPEALTPQEVYNDDVK